MQAIQTKFIGPTNTRGSRIKASCESGQITIEADHGLGIAQRHAKAAQALATKLGWSGHWAQGGTAKGYVFVNIEYIFVNIEDERDLFTVA